MSKYARGHAAWGICGRSARKMLLKDMIFDGRYPNMRVDPAWYEPKDPLDYAPRVNDPIALWRPAPDNWRLTSPVLTLGLPTNIHTAPLTWTEAVSDAYQVESYTVQARVAESDDEADWATIAIYSVPRDEFGADEWVVGERLVTLPVPGLLYQFRVVATDSGHLSSISNVVTMTGVFVSPVIAVTGITGGTISIGWAPVQAPCSISTYDLYYRPTTSDPYVLYSSYSYATLSAGVPVAFVGYQFRLTARDTCGNSGVSNEIIPSDSLTQHVEVLMFTNGSEFRNSTNGGATWGQFFAVNGPSNGGSKSSAWSTDLGIAVYLSTGFSLPRYSTDRGRTWINCSFPGGAPVVNGNGSPLYLCWHPQFKRFICFCTSIQVAGMPVAYSSADGINFYPVGSSPGSTGNNNFADPGISVLNAGFITPTGSHVAYNNGIAGGILHSSDMQNFSRTSYFLGVRPASRDLGSYSPSLGIGVAADNNGFTYASSSSNGFTDWVSQANTFGLNRVVWAEALAKFIGCGSSLARYSSDGNTWLNGTVPALSSIGNSHTIWVPELGKGFTVGTSSGPQYCIAMTVNGIDWVTSLSTTGTQSGVNLLACTYFTFP